MSTTTKIDNSEAIDRALAFCTDYPLEAPTTAARIYGANEATVRNKAWRARRRQRSPPKPTGGHNRILSDIEVQAIGKYVRDMYITGLGATRPMVAAAIAHLRGLRGQDPPSTRWFQLFLKAHPTLFKAVKTKPIARNRVPA
jgi:hypothetical protein